MIKLKLKELYEKDTVEVDLCNGGFRIDNNRYGHETIECDLIIQEIYRLYKDIEGLKAFKPYQEANPLETLVMQEIAEASRLIYEKLKGHSGEFNNALKSLNKFEFIQIIQGVLTFCFSKNYNKY